MDSKEIDDFKEQVRLLTEAMQGLSADTDNASKSMSEDIGKKFPNAAKPAMAALSGLGNAVTDVTAALYKGERGMSVMANGIDKLVDGVQAAVAVFTLFTPMGKALSLGSKLLLNGVALAAKGVSSLNKLNAEQSDRLYKVYQDLSNVGAAGAGGLEKLFDSMQRAGFTAAELDQFAAALKRNARDLTVFGATTAQGAENLAAMSGGILKGNLGLALTNLGYNAESLANSTANYLALQNQLGRVQLKTATQLQQEATAYAVELDKLTRLTGLSREEQEKRQRSLISDERYAGFMATEARQQGFDTQALTSFFSLIEDESTRKGLQHLLAGGGAAASEEARRVMMTDPRAYERMMRVARGGSAVGEAQGFYGAARGYMTGAGGQLARFGATGPGVSVAANLESAERFAQMSDAASKAGLTLDQYVKREQDRAAADQGELKRQNELRLQQLGAAQALDTTVNKFNLLNSTTDTLTKGFSNLTKILPGAPAGGAPAGTAGAGAALPRGGMGGAAGSIDTSGLRIKSPEATAGGGTSPALIELARTIQNQLGGDLKYFSAFNDSYHQGTTSAHAAGRALDFTLTDPSKAAQIAALIRRLPGVKYVQDEYNNPSSRATAGHIHAEINGAAGFNGMVSGPMSGYRPNVLMHGTEQLSITPVGRESPAGTAVSSDMSELVGEVRELVSLTRNQLYTSQRILKYQQ